MQQTVVGDLALQAELQSQLFITWEKVLFDPALASRILVVECSLYSIVPPFLEDLIVSYFIYMSEIPVPDVVMDC